MFSRRKPPRLGIYDELQQTYNDSNNLTGKYLSLEESNQVEESLRGWKSLHTSLLFKIELFEKQKHKMNNDELAILRDLKTIRDQNVRHLIRMQLRMDEVTRRNGAKQTRSSSVTSTENVRTLRGSGSNGSKTNSTNSNVQRTMRKSLRSGASSLSQSGQTHRAPKSVPSDVPKQASQAANLSWQSPPLQKLKTNPDLHTDAYIENRADGTLDKMAYISDQDSFEFDDRTWEKIVDDVEPPDFVNIEENGYDRVNPVTHSMEDLIVRDTSSTSPSIYEEPQLLKPPSLTLDHVSKSTSDIKTEKRKYTYTQPKPIDVSRLMKKSGAMHKSTAGSTSNKIASGSKCNVHTKAAPKPPLSHSSSTPNNITKTSPTKKVANRHDASVSRSHAYSKAPTSSSQPSKKSNISFNYIKANSQNVKKTASNRNAAAASAENVNNKKEQRAGNIIDPNDNPGVIDSDGDAQSAQNSAESEPDSVGSASTMDEEDRKALIGSIKGIDPIAAKQILDDVVVHGDEVYWDDIVGLESAKNSLKEAVVYPFLRPDLFQGLREPTRGMLLFGPPGTGKTMLARAVATESKSTFFSITASSLTSKYLGESEKLVKALFLLAKKLSPSIVFIDEIDSLLSSRTENEIESTRRIKNEFLVQWSELSSAAAGRDRMVIDDRVLVLGATNLPWMIDEAARRRFVKRQYIPLPENDTRKHQIMKLLQYQNNVLSDEDYSALIDLTQGFSGSDITALAKDSAMGPLRSLGDRLLSTPTEQIRPINIDDFKNSLNYIRPSVSSEGLEEYEKWATRYGSSGV